tara:strand:- start:1760 stop:2464 length:705 start_codon:yes stop_codon:yes gene_type:complete
MIKRLFDLTFSIVGLIIISPIFLFFMLLVFLYDFNSPFYVASRVGKGGKIFKMIKLRSMKVNADKSGVASTANDDDRITPVGKIIRKFKFDELSQLINVFNGSMSLVGPRPQVSQDVDLYTNREHRLLTVRPGITDYSSIVFSDEGEILEGSDDPDKDYNLLIRPWKSRLGLIYIDCQSFFLDIKLIALTILSFLNKQSALRLIHRDLSKRKASSELLTVILRQEKLSPAQPPK